MNIIKNKYVKLKYLNIFLKHIDYNLIRYLNNFIKEIKCFKNQTLKQENH